MPIGGVPLQDVEPPMLNRLYAQLLAGDDEHRKLAARSVSYVHVILHRVFRDAMKWSLFDAETRRTPQTRRGPVLTRVARCATWTAAELGTFLRASPMTGCKALWWLLGEHGDAPRGGDRLAVEGRRLEGSSLSINRTLVTTDARRAGDPGMAWSTPKTAKGRRNVALDAATVTALKAHTGRGKPRNG